MPLRFVWLLLGMTLGFALGGSFVWALLLVPHESKMTAELGHQIKSLWIPDDSSGLFALWTAAFTGVLAVSTIGLWLATRKLWRAGERQIAVAKDSADAAKRSTDAFMSAEKAHLFIDIKEETVAKTVSTYGRWDKSDGMFADEVETPGVEYFFTNIGERPRS
jgi:hypothetical protein